MTYKRAGLLLPMRGEPQIDHELHVSFDDAHLGAGEIFNDLRTGQNRLKELEQDFMASGGQTDIDLRATHLDGRALEEREAALLGWKEQLLENDGIEPGVRQAYRWAVNESIAKVRMLTASAHGDMRLFQRWNEFAYGQPDETIYRAALDWIAADAARTLHSGDATKMSAAERALSLVDGKRGYRELLIPDSYLFQAVREAHFRPKGYFALLLAGTSLPEDGKVDPSVGEPAIEHILKYNLQSPFTRKFTSGKTWGVSPSRQTFNGPQEYNMPVRRFIGLPLGHEGGSHILEHMNGQRGPLALASTGFDRYEQTGEGRPLIREQLPYETFDKFGKTLRWRDILNRHIATSYGAGVGDDSSHSFHEVYNFMYSLELPYQLGRHTDASAAEAATHRRTWSLVTDVLKGTDGQGGAQLRRKLYLEGNVACWLTASLRGPEAIDEGDLGKFDISNPRHIAILQARGLLPTQQAERETLSGEDVTLEQGQSST